MRILLIEDEPRLAAALREALKPDGFVFDSCLTGEEGLALGLREDYDAAILDLGLPDIPGLDILKQWRRAGQDFPVLILTARAAWPERVLGLNSGADDYMSKPFAPAEVAARLHALIRRRHGRADSILSHGDLEIRPAESCVWYAGQPIELTAQERKILIYLMQRPGRIVSESELTDHIYYLQSSRHSNGIQVCIGRLRKKLGRDMIRTLRGMGYRLE